MSSSGQAGAGMPTSATEEVSSPSTASDYRHFLEVAIENVLQVPLLLHSVQFLPAPGVTVQPISFTQLAAVLPCKHAAAKESLAAQLISDTSDTAVRDQSNTGHAAITDATLKRAKHLAPHTHANTGFTDVRQQQDVSGVPEPAQDACVSDQEHKQHNQLADGVRGPLSEYRASLCVLSPGAGTRHLLWEVRQQQSRWVCGCVVGTYSTKRTRWVTVVVLSSPLASLVS